MFRTRALLRGIADLTFALGDAFVVFGAWIMRLAGRLNGLSYEIQRRNHG